MQFEVQINSKCFFFFFHHKNLHLAPILYSFFRNLIFEKFIEFFQLVSSTQHIG